MPCSVKKTPRQERLWAKAKELVREQYGLTEAAGARYWRLVMGIYLRMTRASRKKRLRKARLVRGHYVKTPSGKRVWRREHYDIRPPAKVKVTAFMPSTTSREKEKPQKQRSAETKVVDLPLEQVQPDPEQHRRYFPDEHIDALATSIKEVGQLTPIVVRPLEGGKRKRYQIVAGECRYRALKKLGAKTIRAIIRTRASEEQLLTEQVVENITRQAVTPIEEATAYRQLADFYIRRAKRRKEWQRRDLSKPSVRARLEEEARAYVAMQTGKTQQHIAFYLRLKELHPEVQELIHRGLLTPRHGAALARLTEGVEDEEAAPETEVPAEEGQLFSMPKATKRERLLHQVRLARHAVKTGMGADELQSVVTAYLRQQEQQAMFEEAPEAEERRKLRMEHKARFDELTEKLAIFINRLFNREEQEYRLDVLTDGDIEQNIRRLQGAIKSISEIVKTLEAEMHSREAMRGIRKQKKLL